jgi:hypothetical protein
MLGDDEIRHYGTVFAWSKELGIPLSRMKRRLLRCPGVLARKRDGNGLIEIFAKEDVLRLCEDLVQRNSGADRTCAPCGN